MIRGAELRNIDGMVLWDPVVSGRDYIKELTTLHRAMLKIAHVRSKHRRQSEESTEVLGFPLSHSMLRGLEKIDLLSVHQSPANNILVIDSHQKARQRPFCNHLESLDTRVEFHHLPDARLWNWIEDVGKVLVPHQILQCAVSWASEVCP